MKKNNKIAFTLVELIVVVTILAILATIGFVSYSSYLTGVRDTNRLSQLVSIHDGLALYSTKNNLPIPEDNVEVKVTVNSVDYTVGYQGNAGANTLETIDFTKGGKDPRDDTYFTYMLTSDRKHFQLMAWLEEAADVSASVFPQAQAVDYSDRIPTVYGKKLGILTDSSNQPIQEVVSTEIVLDGTGTEYIAHQDDNETITSSGSNALYGAYVEIAGKGNSSCKEILSRYPYMEGADGQYWIKADSKVSKLPCDMTTEGGGWTLVLHAHDSDIEKYDSRGNGSWIQGSTAIDFSGVENSFKFSDTAINAIRDGGDYMLVGNNLTDPENTYYTPGSCVYDHDTIVSGSCESMFNDIAFTDTTGLSTGDNTSNAKGIGVWSSGIITNFNAASAACYQETSGACTGSSNDVSVKMYVR